MIAAIDDLDEKILSSSSVAFGFGAWLVRRIIENLHLQISDFKTILNGCGCNAEVLLKSLSLVTTNSNGKLAFVGRTGRSGRDDFLHKALQIIGLAELAFFILIPPNIYAREQRCAN
mmetsp:Transcript_7924/g.9925  ORF Transcript_7924/g.9925 Transcript_7924/m.9925 type:complete len:117 (+) Transcript_7924:845-1195(+)